MISVVRLEERERLGLHIRKVREARGLSQAALGKRTGHSGRYVMDLELGRVDPRTGDLLDIARALNAKVEALLSQDNSNDVAAGTLESEAATRRREFLSILAAAGVGLVDIERLAAPVVDAAYLRDAETVTTALLGRWYSAQPAVLLPPAMAHLSALQQALPAPTGLENLTGRTALLVGYLFAKLERFGEARTYYAQAESLARDTDDLNLRAVTLIAHSGLHCWRRAGDAQRSRDLVEEAVAVAGNGAPFLVRTAVLARRAEERAAAGDETGCLGDLEAAERTISHSDDVWYGPRDAAELSAVRGTCELLLGRHRDAAATLGWTLQRMDPSAVNWRALVAADRDRALASL